MENNFTIRTALIDDAELLFEWSNDSVTRANSFNSKLISYYEHITWLHSKLASNKSLLYVIEFGQKPIAVVRLEKNEETVISLVVAPEARGRGYAADCIKLTCDLYRKKNTDSILAYIKTDNIASIKSFKKAGFVMVKESNINKSPCYIFKL